MASIPITHGLYCPYCRQLTRREWLQPSLTGKRPPLPTTDCLNPDCDHYYVTLSVVEFMRCDK